VGSAVGRLFAISNCATERSKGILESPHSPLVRLHPADLSAPHWNPSLLY
jgi:hypothetical protein